MRAASLTIALLACSLGLGCGGESPRAVGTMRLDPAVLLGDAPDTVSGPAIDALVETTVEEARSAAIRERVAERLALSHDPGFFAISEGDRGSWRGASMDETVQRLGAHHTVERRAASLVVEVGYTDPDPERAVQICNASMEALMDLYAGRHMREIDERMEWLGAQNESLRSELASAREGEREADVTRIEATLATMRAELGRLQLDRRRRWAPVEVVDRCAVAAR